LHASGASRDAAQRQMPRACTGRGSSDLTEIMDLGLELDDEQRAGLGVEGEDIDPASRTVAADFDLAGGRRVARSQATYGVCGHPRVCRFALSRPIADVRRLDPNDEASAKIVLGATDSMPR